MIKVILFDFDGTIADSFSNFLEIVSKISSKYKLPEISDDKISELRLYDAKTLVKKLKIPFYKIPFIARDMKKLQHENIEQIRPFGGMPETLYKLKNKGYKLGVITSNGERNVISFIKKNDMNIFDYIYCDSSIFGKDKVIHKFLRKNSISKENVLYVGDEIRDIQACRKVGIKMIAVSWGFNSKEGLVSYYPDFIIDKPSDLITLLK